MTVSGLQGLIKGVVLALVKMRPEAACRTCCLEGSIESSNFAKKSMPRRGVATAANKKSNLKFWLQKQTVRRLSICFYKVQTCGLRQLEWGRIETDTPESTKKLFCVSCRKIKFFGGKKDIAVADSGSE